MKKTKNDYSFDDRNLSVCELKIEELRELKKKYGYIKNSYGITKEKTSFISESSAIISKSMSNNPVLQKALLTLLIPFKLKNNLSKNEIPTKNLPNYKTTQNTLTKSLKSPYLSLITPFKSEIAPYEHYKTPTNPSKSFLNPLKSIINPLNPDLNSSIASLNPLMTPLTGHKGIPLEEFDQFRIEDKEPSSLFEKGPIRGFSRWKDKNDKITWRECLIEEWNEKEGIFVIKWMHNERKKKVKRLNLMFEGDNKEEFEKRVGLAEEKRDLNEYYHEMKEIIEFQAKIVNIEVHEDILINIIQKVFGKRNHSLEEDRLIMLISKEINQNFSFITLKFEKEIAKSANLNSYYKNFRPEFNLKHKKTSPISQIFNVIETEIDYKQDIPLILQQKSLENDLFVCFPRRDKGDFLDLKGKNNLNQAKSSAFTYQYPFKKILAGFEKDKRSIYNRISGEDLIFTRIDQMIMSFMMKINEIDIFEVFTKLKIPQNPLLSRREFLLEAEISLHEKITEIARITYKIEKVIEAYISDIKDFNNQNNSAIIDEIKLFLRKKVNILLESLITHCISRSIQSLIMIFELYSNILPRNIDNMEKTIEKRKISLKKSQINLFSYNIEQQKEEFLILNKLFRALMMKLNDENKLKTHILNVFPCFFTCKIVLNTTLLEKKKKGRGKLEREALREISRKGLQNYREIDIIKEIIKQNDEICDLEEFSHYLLKFKNKNITLYHFGYFNQNSLLFKTEPSLDFLEEKLKLLLKKPFFELETIEKVIDLNHFCYKTESQGVKSLSIALDNLFTLSLYEPYALLMVFFLYEFYYLQRKTLIIDILNDFKDIPRIELEYSLILKDLFFFQSKLPNLIELGLISFDLTEIKRVLIELLNNYLNSLKSSILNYFLICLKTDENTIKKLLKDLEQVPLTLKIFIEAYQYLENPDFITKRALLEENSLKIRELFVLLEALQIELPKEGLLMYFMSQMSVKKVLTAEKNMRKGLFESKARFKGIVSLENEGILKELAVLRDKCLEISKAGDLEKADQWSNLSKGLEKELQALYQRAKGTNENERVLGYDITNFEDLTDLVENFEKTVKLWDFIEKWRFRGDFWMGSSFEMVDEQDMRFMIKEGLHLMNSLEDYFIENSEITSIIVKIMVDLNKYNEYLQIIRLLKHESFKQKHWEVLWLEIKNSRNHIDITKTTLKELIFDENIMKYSNFIYKISNEAQEQYNLGIEITRLESRVKDLPIKIKEDLGIFYLRDPIGNLTSIKEFSRIASLMRGDSKFIEVFGEKLINISEILKKSGRFMRFLMDLQENILYLVELIAQECIKKSIIEELYQKLVTEHQKHVKKIMNRNMIYFFTLFERTDEKETLKSQEKSLETIEFTKEALIQVVSLLKDLIKGFKESNPRLFPLSDQEILFIYTSEPNKCLYKLIQLFPGIKEPILNENMIIGFLTQTKETLYLTKELTFNTNSEAYKAIEIGSKESLKASFIKAFRLYKAIFWDYNEFYKFIWNKSLITQTGLLLMDLSFYREIARNITNQSLLTFKKEASASLQAFIDRKQRNMSLIYDLFLSRVLYYRDIIEDLQGKTLYDFEYLVQPKFSIESKKTPLKPLDDVNYEAFIDDISMISLDYKLKYGWEITQIDPYFIFTPSIPRIFFNFIMNINLNKGILLKNSQEIPYIALGALLARPLIVLDPISLEKPLEMIEKGINSEFWILIRLDKQDYGFLTKIAYIFKEITEKQKVLGILLKGIELNDSIIEIPRSFTEQFRSITIKEWHLSKIIETRLFIIGISFEKAQRISKKMLLLYHILTNSFENQYIMMGNLQNKQDFIETKKSLLGKSIINEKLLLKALEGVNIDFSSIENQLKQSIKALLKGNILKSVLKPLLSLVFNEETVYSKGEIPLKENFMDCIKDYLKRKDREMVRKGVISNLQRAYESFQQEKSFIIAGRTNIGKIALIKMTMAIFNDLQGINIQLQVLRVDRLLSLPELLTFLEKALKKPLEKLPKPHKSLFKQGKTIKNENLIVLSIDKAFPSNLIEYLIEAFIKPANMPFRNPFLLERPRLIFELESLESLSPGILSIIPIIPLKKETFSIQSDFSHFIERVYKKCAYLKGYDNRIHFLFKSLLLATYEENPNTSFSKKALYKNFISIFEIQLNEFRKLAFSLGLYTQNNNAIINPGDNRKKRLSSESIMSPISPSSLLQNKAIIVQALMTSKLDSLFLFSFIHSLSFLEEPIIQKISSSLINKLEDLKESHNFCNFIIETHFYRNPSLFDLAFDLIQGKWLLWEAFISQPLVKLTTDLQAINLKIQELVRFNPKLLELKTIQAQITNESADSFIYPQSQLFFLTASSKRSQYFLDFFIKYQRKFLLFGKSQIGKSALLDNRTALLLSEGEFSVFKTGVSSLKGLQNRLEKLLLRNSAVRNMSFAGTKAFWVIEDMNLDEKEVALGLFKGILQGKGWVNKKKGEFVRLETKNLAICGVFSIGIRENKGINEGIKDLMEKIPSIYMKEPSLYDYEGIFRLYGENSLKNDINSNKIKETMDKISITLAFFFYKLKDIPISFGNSFSTIFPLQKSLQILKDLAYFELNPINNDNNIKTLFFLLNQYLSFDFLPFSLITVFEPSLLEKSPSETSNLSLDCSKINETDKDQASFKSNSFENNMHPLSPAFPIPIKRPYSFSYRKRSVLMNSPYKSPLYKAGSMSKRPVFEEEQEKTEEILLDLHQKITNIPNLHRNPLDSFEKVLGFFEKILIRVGLLKEKGSFYKPPILFVNEEFLQGKSDSGSEDSHEEIPLLVNVGSKEDWKVLLKAFEEIINGFLKGTKGFIEEIGLNRYLYETMITVFFIEISEENLLITSEFSIELTKEIIQLSSFIKENELMVYKGTEGLLEALWPFLQKSLLKNKRLLVYLDCREGYNQVIEEGFRVIKLLLSGSEPLIIDKEVFEEFYEENRKLPAYRALNKSHLYQVFKNKLKKIRFFIDFGANEIPFNVKTMFYSINFTQLYYGRFKPLPSFIETREKEKENENYKEKDILTELYKVDLDLKRNFYKENSFLVIRSFQQIEGKIESISLKIVAFLQRKEDLEKKKGIIGRIISLKESKIDKFSKELNKSLNDKEKTELLIKRLSKEDNLLHKDEIDLQKHYLSILTKAFDRKKASFDLFTKSLIPFQKGLFTLLQRECAFIEDPILQRDLSMKIAGFLVVLLPHSSSYRGNWRGIRLGDINIAKTLMSKELYYNILGWNIVKNNDIMDICAILMVIFKEFIGIRVQVYDPGVLLMPLLQRVLFEEGISRKVIIYEYFEDISFDLSEENNVIWITKDKSRVLSEKIEIFNINLDIEDEIGFKELLLDHLAIYKQDYIRQGVINRLKGTLIDEKTQGNLELLLKDLERVEIISNESVFSFQERVIELNTEGKGSFKSKKSNFQRKKEYYEDLEEELKIKEGVVELIKGLWGIRKGLQNLCVLGYQGFGDKDLWDLIRIGFMSPLLNMNEIEAFVLTNIQNGMRLDQQILLKFFIELYRLENKDCLQLGLVLNARIDNSDISQGFENVSNEDKWNNVHLFFCEFFQYHEDLLAPLLSFSQKDLIFAINSSMNSNNEIKIEKNSLDLYRDQLSAKKDSIIKEDSSNRKESHTIKSTFLNVKDRLKEAKSIRINADQWLGLTVWKSLTNISHLVPSFKTLIEDFSINHEKWKKFLRVSMKDKPEIPFNTINLLDKLLLIKHIRPEGIEILIKGSKDPENGFSEYVISNIRKPIVYFYELEGRKIENSLQIKAFRMKETYKKLLIKTSKDIEKLLKGYKEGYWILLSDFQTIEKGLLQEVIKAIHDLMKDPSLTKGQIWIPFQISEYIDNNPLNIEEKDNELLKDFFKICFKIYNNPPNTIKSQMTSLYMIELEEFFYKREFKIDIPSFSFKSVFSSENPKKKTDINSYNLHSLSKSTNPSSNIQTSLFEKLKFNLKFFFSLLNQRRKVINPNIGILVIQTDFTLILEELFSFMIAINHQNPFIFLEKALDHLFEGENDNGYSSELLKAFLREDSRHVVSDTRCFKYRLFTNYSAVSQEENLYKNIQSFPKEDPIEIFGLTLNEELETQYKSSQRFINSARNAYLEMEKKQNRFDKIIKGLEEKGESEIFYGEKFQRKLVSLERSKMKEIEEIIQVIELILGFLDDFPLEISDVEICLSSMLNQEDDLFKTIIYNELFIGFLLKSHIQRDLLKVKSFIENDYNNKEEERTLVCIKRNEIPKEWGKFGLSIRKDNMRVFLKGFFIRLEFLHKLVYKRKCEIFPIMPLNKLFDPLHFLFSYIYQISLMKNMDFSNFKISLTRIKVPEPKQTMLSGIQSSGFLIKRGNINPHNNYLEDENIREFNNPMSLLLLNCVPKINGIIKNNTSSIIEISFEISDRKTKNDFEWEFNKQLQKPVNFLEFDSKNQKSELKEINKDNQRIDEQIVYFVRVPFELTHSHSFRFYFYFKSLKSQEYWLKKDTRIYLDSEI